MCVHAFPAYRGSDPFLTHCRPSSLLPCKNSQPSSGGWGWALIIVLLVSGALYVGGGIGYAVKVQGIAPAAAVAAHPHLEKWHQVAGLVKDGAVFSHAFVQAKLQGGQPQPLPNDAEPSTSSSSAVGSDKEALIKSEDAGGGSNATGGSASTAAAGEGGYGATSKADTESDRGRGEGGGSDSGSSDSQDELVE